MDKSAEQEKSDLEQLIELSILAKSISETESEVHDYESRIKSYAMRYKDLTGDFYRRPR